MLSVVQSPRDFLPKDAAKQYVVIRRLIKLRCIQGVGEPARPLGNAAHGAIAGS
jgi:hypothetical protein